MEGAFGSRSRPRRPAINITPLIDVLFLLLIFFMVSSTFRQSPGIEVALPQAQNAAEQQQSPYEIIVRADGGMLYRDQEMTRESLQQELIRLKEEEPDATLILRADEGAPFQRGLDVMDVARGVGFEQLQIPTQPLKP